MEVLIIEMCNLYSITTNQAAILALFRVVNRYVGNFSRCPVFPLMQPLARRMDPAHLLQSLF